MRKVIALTGYSRCGKDMTADMLKTLYEEEGKTVAIFNFSHALKVITAKILNITMDELEEYKNCEHIIPFGNEELTMRKILNRISQVFKSLHGDDYFTNLVSTAINDVTADIIIITDLRYMGEYDMLKFNFYSTFNKGSFKVIRVTRPHKDCKKRVADEEVDNIPYDILFTSSDIIADVKKLKEQI